MGNKIVLLNRNLLCTFSETPDEKMIVPAERKVSAKLNVTFWK